MSYTVISTFVYVIVWVCAWSIYLKFKRPGNLPPGPKGYPIVGNLFQLDADRPWHSLIEWKKTYGDIMYIRLFNQDVIVLNSAKAAGDLLDRRAANYSQRPRIPVAECLTGGLIIALIDHGTRWRSMRRATHETLNIRASVSYFPIHMREGIQLALNILDSPQECHDHIYRFTSFTIASLIYNDTSRRHAITEELSNLISDISLATAPGRYLANHIPILEHIPEFFARWKQEMKAKYNMYNESIVKFFLPIKELVPIFPWTDKPECQHAPELLQDVPKRLQQGITVLVKDGTLFAYPACLIEPENNLKSWTIKWWHLNQPAEDTTHIPNSYVTVEVTQIVDSLYHDVKGRWSVQLG
ncbi:cytochrome p450 [Moniliophthora roreri]|nr:cytochrome p450 [Moniliophthora roreri]